MKRVILMVVLAVLGGVAVAPVCHAATTATTTKRGVNILPKPGEKVPLDATHYFVYGFTKPPKLGTGIMRVEIFTTAGARDTSYVIKGDADMPSMRGAHASGDKDFSVSAKGLYLLPIRLVMPGDWEVSFTFLKEGKTVLRGVYLFDL